MLKPLTMWITTNWKILKEMRMPEHLTCLLWNLYAEATVRTGHGTTDWFQIRKGIRQGCILSHCLFNFYAEYIMRNAGLEEAQAGIKIAGRNINNHKYADDTTLTAESEEELKRLFLVFNLIFKFFKFWFFTLFYFTILYWFCNLIFFKKACWWKWKRRVKKLA